MKNKKSSGAQCVEINPSYYMQLLGQEREDLITIQVPETSLILTPNMSLKEIEEEYKDWLKTYKL
jgi:hypothetical protein